MRLAFIVNPNAAGGKGVSRWRRLEETLNHAGISHQAVHTTHPRHAVSLAAALAPTHDILVAVGGDGTVHETANGLLDAPDSGHCALGVFPTGTGNDFATAYGIDANPQQFTRLLCKTNIVTQDALLISGDGVKRWCISMADAGLAADVARRINMGRKSGKLAYVKAALKSVASFASESVAVTGNGGSGTYNALTIAFGIHRANGGGLLQCPDAVIDDGLVHISLTEAVSLYEVPGLLKRLYNGTFTAHSKVHDFQSVALDILLPTGWWMEADGEPIGSGAFSLRVMPGALRVLVAQRPMPGNHGRPTCSRNGHGIIASIVRSDRI